MNTIANRSCRSGAFYRRLLRSLGFAFLLLFGAVLVGSWPSVLSTLIFFTILAIIFTPIVHRLLHKLHLDLGKKELT